MANISRSNFSILFFFNALLCFGTLFIPSRSQATPVISGPIVNASNGHTYFLLDADSWTNSEAMAISMGGQLATIRNRDENTWIYSTFSTYGGINRALWTGLTSQAAPGVYDPSSGQSTGIFTWSSGEAVTFRNWSAGQPNNAWNSSAPTENWVHMWAPGGYGGAPDGTWNDYVNSASLDGVAGIYGVVEILGSTGSPGSVPEPSTLAFFGLGLLGLSALNFKKRFC